MEAASNEPASTDEVDSPDSPATESNAHPAVRSNMRELVDNPWIVLGLLFFVMAVLGLPLLWSSRGFSKSSKAILTIVVLIYTALIFWGFYLVMVWCYHSITSSLGM